MTVADVRKKIGDRSRIEREVVDGDGVAQFFKLTYVPVSDVQVWLNDAIQVEAVDYTVDAVNGVIEFINAPIANDKLVFQYYWSIFTDADIDGFLTESGSNVNIGAAFALLAIAADAAKIAKRETLSGGGGLGAVTRDTSVAAKELRATAKALMDWEREYGADIGIAIPADGLTEIPWTEASVYEIEDQRFVREP